MGKKYITQKDTKNADFDEIDIALADLSLSNKKSSKHRKECTTSSCTKFVLVKDSSHDTELMLDEMINTLHMINNSLYFMKKADDTVVTVNGFCNQIYDVIETYTFRTLFPNFQKVYSEMYMAKMMLINDIRNCRIIKIDGIFLEFIPLFEEMTYNLMQKTIGKLHTCDTFKNVNIDRYRQILPAAQKWLKSYTFTNKKYYYPGTIGIYDIISNEKVIIANDMNKPLFLKLKYVLAEIIETTLLITRSKNPPHESPLPHDDSIWALLKYYVMPKMEEMEKNGIYHMHTTATKECIEFINAMLKILFEKKKDSSSAIDKFSITLKGKEVEFVNCSIDEFWFTITEYFESVGYNSTKIWLQPMQDWEFYMWRISYNKSHKLISI